MKAIESWINKWIIWQLNPGFRFKFVGLNVESEGEELERDIKAATTFMSLREVRRKRGLPDDIEDDDMILNQTWLSKHQGDAMADMQEESGSVTQPWETIGDNGEREEVDDEELNEFEKSVKTTLLAHKDNPMLNDALSLFREIVKTDESNR